MFAIKASFKNKIPFLLLVILSLFPILPNVIQSISIGLFVLLSLIVYKGFFQENWKTFTWKPLLINVGWFMILCLTIIYSPQKGKGVDHIIRGLSLIVFPLILIYFLPQIDKKKLKIFMGLYIFTHLFLIFFMYVKIVEGIDTIGYINEAGERIKGLSKENWFAQFKLIRSMPFSLSRYYLNENEISSFFVHKAYLSLGYLWSIFMMVYVLLKERLNLIFAIVLILVSLLFVFVIIYFTSIPNIFSLVTLLPLFIFFELPNRRKKLIFVIVALISMLGFSQTNFAHRKIFNDERLSHGINETKRLWLSIIKNEDSDGSNIRIETWKCAGEVISKSFFFGYGVGGESTILKECYVNSECSLCSEYSFNAHNNYASLLINGGIITLFLFLFSMCYFIWLSFKVKSNLYLFFLLLFMINLVSESMLNRIHGILFFAFFNSIFFTTSWKKYIIDKN